MKPPPMDHKVKRPKGPWIPSGNTDVRATFEAERKRLEEKSRSNVTPLRKEPNER